MNDQMTPFFSVITVVYNGAATIERTIQSVLGQAVDGVEYIIVDGGSTDGTVDIVERYGARIAHFVSEPDRGIYDAWNKGLRAARGEWIAFLGADDVYAPEALAQYAQTIRGSADAQLEYVSSRVAFTKNGKILRIYGDAWKWPRFGKSMNVGHVGSMHHRSLFDRLGLYDESYRICGDYELLLRARDTLHARYFPDVTAVMSVGGVSNRQLGRSFSEMARAKTETGGRARWRSRLESAWGYAKARVRSVVWY